jgi:hypothetical protein
MKSKTIYILAATAVFAVAAFLILDRGGSLTGGHDYSVNELIARNVEARGGADAWRAVTSLRFEGRMGLGQGMHVPYTLEQQRPGRMCLEFEFEGEKATQCVADGAGWKRLPYRGRRDAEAMTDEELRDIADAASIDGLLFDSAERGFDIQKVGRESLEGRDTIKLEVTMPSGSKRRVYLDAETALEVRVDAVRMLRGTEHVVETWYHDWQETRGLLIPRRQVTYTEGMSESNLLTVEHVIVNPPIADDRFRMPVVAASSGTGGNAS